MAPQRSKIRSGLKKRVKSYEIGLKKRRHVRILHFYKTYFPDSYGGIEQVINQLARSSAQQGHMVDVLSLSRDATKNSIVWDNHTAHRSRLAFEIASTGFSFSVFGKFAALARAADVIHYHFPWPFLDVVHFVTRASKPTVITYHSDILRQRTLLKLYNPLMMRFLGSVDRIVATSPNYLATSDVLDKFREKTVVIPIGLDRSTYPEPSSKLLAEWRGRIGDGFFLFIGMLLQWSTHFAGRDSGHRITSHHRWFRPNGARASKAFGKA